MHDHCITLFIFEGDDNVKCLSGVVSTTTTATATTATATRATSNIVINKFCKKGLPPSLVKRFVVKSVPGRESGGAQLRFFS